jgi:signal transduction histidine kinase
MPASILVVDDRPENLLAMEATLEPLARPLVLVRSGEDALRQVLTTDFALILLDVQMPNMDGFETAALLRQRERSRHTPILFVTAYGSGVEGQARGYAHGAVDFLFKPYDPDILRAKVAVFVELFERAERIAREQAGRAAAEAHRTRAEEANRAKDEFLAMLSHELRTPLNSMIGWIRLLRDDALQPAMRARAIDTIERSANLQAQLIEELLDVSRMVTGKLRLELSPCTAAEVVAAALDGVRPAADAKGVKLMPLETWPTAQVSADPLRLQQAIGNLLGNAVKFTPAGKQVRTEVRLSADDRVEIVVDDEGVGIAPEFLPHLFQRFRQGEPGVAPRTRGGLGLGLSIVRDLVDLHGGTVEARSAGRGRGSSFVISLPAIEPARMVRPDSERTPPPPDSAGQTLEGMHVLVVEDHPDGREMLVAALERLHARVTSVGTAAQALEMLSQVRPTFILSDIGLPEMDGCELMREVRRRPADQGGAVPAVAVTAQTRKGDRERILAAGFDAHVAKPVDIDALAALIVALAAKPRGARQGG